MKKFEIFNRMLLLKDLLTGEKAGSGPWHVTANMTSQCKLKCPGCRYHCPDVDFPSPAVDQNVSRSKNSLKVP